MIGRYEQFCTAISMIHHAIQKIERVEMEKYGLKGPHAQCLLAISQYPNGITAAKLCDICEKDKAAISRAVAELEQADMLVRQDPDGKRYRSRLYLTQRGKEVADNVNHLVHTAVSKASEGYDTESREIFVHVLNLIAGNLQSICRNGLEDDRIAS
jgi:DNA-binding MarR family transcriptional regulator